MARLSEEALDELAVLPDLLPESDFRLDEDSGEVVTGQMFARLEPPADIVRVSAPSQRLDLKHLPPIVVCFRIGEDYPESQPPQVDLTCPWLTIKQLGAICSEMESIWQQRDGEVVLFAWYGWLKNDGWAHLNLGSTLDLQVPTERQLRISDTSTVLQDAASLKWLLRHLSDYNDREERRVFEQNTYECDVCGSTKEGAACYPLTVCRHVFCKGCLKGWFETQISEGAVRALTCPECSDQANPRDVKATVEPKLYERWDKLLLQQTIEQQSDVVTCPRCQGPVIKESDQNLALCPDPKCCFNFCILCKRAWHGVEGCVVEDMTALVEEYEVAGWGLGSLTANLLFPFVAGCCVSCTLECPPIGAGSSTPFLKCRRANQAAARGAVWAEKASGSNGGSCIGSLLATKRQEMPVLQSPH
eukprot:m.96387 g.96387  ORF g.96387 m.96387 type:complete len:417 (-) comp15188_c1_seq2:273-1523(-)